MMSASPLSIASRRRFSWFAALVFLLNAWLPAAVQAHGPGQMQAVQICSVAGPKRIALLETEVPGGPQRPTQAEHHEHCPLCAPAAALPGSTQTIFFSALQAAAPPQAPDFAPVPTQQLVPAPRGPPSRS